jgi:hypothetical protein
MPVALSRIERFMVKRFRAIYARHTGYRSALEGYEGLVTEMRHSLATFTLEQRLDFDAKTLPEVLGGPFSGVVRSLARKYPRVAQACFLAVIPRGLRYLLGPNHRDGASRIAIPRCRFLTEGGVDLCQNVCKGPTEHFFAHEYGLDIEFHPDLERKCCSLEFKGKRS